MDEKWHPTGIFIPVHVSASETILADGEGRTVACVKTAVVVGAVVLTGT